MLFLGCVLPGVAWGADLRLSVGGSVEYDNNVFRSPTDEKGDVVFRIWPRVSVVEDREQFNYAVGYSLPYEIGVKYKDVRDLNHLADASFNYRATPQTELFGSDSFYYVRGLYRQEDEIQDPTLGQVGDGRERVLDNNLSLGVTHRFTPRLSGTLRLSQGIFDTTQFNRANALSFGGVASSAYQLTEQHQVGGGFSYSRQSFDESFNRPASDTDFYNLFGSWQWLFDETTSFDVRIGPALIHSNQDPPPATVLTQRPVPFQVFTTDGLGNPTAIVVGEFNTAPETCPFEAGSRLLITSGGATCLQRVVTDATAISTITNLSPVDLTFLTPPESVADTRITYFANASLTKRWTPNLISSLAYTRRDDTASGIDGGATLDAVTLTSSWRISDRWDASIRTDWTMRKSASEGGRVFVTAVDSGIATVDAFAVPFNVAGAGNLVQIDSSDSLDTQRWGAAARLAYRLTKNTVTAIQYAYNKQSSDSNTVGQSSDFDDHLLTFTVQYNFEPIGLWW